MPRQAIALTLILSLLATQTTLAQLTDAEQEKVMAAIEMTDNGRADRAVETFESLIASHPDEAALRYELGYALMKDYQFDRAATTFRGLRKEMGDVAYQMEGNALDLAGRRADALRTYREGLSRFPTSGRLKMEMGTIRMQEEDYDGALDLYVSGIESDPAFSSNYYRAAWILFNSNARWEGVAYAVAFMVMEKKGAQVEEMSKFLYQTIGHTLWREATAGGTSMTTAAAAAGYDAAIDGEHPTLRAIVAAKKDIMNDAPEDETLTEERVRRFEQRVMDAGHWDAYCRWLTRMGAEKEFSAWLTLHEDAMESFAVWLSKNGLGV